MRLSARFAATLAAAFAVIGLSASTASASFSHPGAPAGSFGSDGLSTGTFLNPAFQGIDQANHKLYVIAFGQLYGYSIPNYTTHTPLGGAFPFGVNTNGYSQVSVDPAGNIYVSHEAGGEVVHKYEPSGTQFGSPFPLAGPFADSCGAALDGAGHIWVGEYGTRKVVGFELSGTSTGQTIDVSSVDAPCRINFDSSSHDLYDTTYNGNTVYRFTASSNYGEHNLVDPGGAQAVAVDGVHHIVYVAHSNFVRAYTPSGGLLEEFATTGFGEGQFTGISVDESDGAVYLSRGSKVYVMRGVVLPDLTVGPASEIGQTEAHISGHVDPAGGGEVSECNFEYGTSLSYGESVSCSPSAPYSGTQEVSAELSGLIVGHIYHYRLSASNAEGTARSEDGTFTTATKPSIVSFSSKNLTASTAELVAQINPNSLDTSYRFEYGTNTAYGTSVPIPDGTIPAGNAPVSVEPVEITGLQRATYHFRVVAENEAGTTFSEDQTFNFFPPECPNRTVRQATGSDYLPDCRAYELVSPGDAGNVVFTAETEEPVATYATSPARFAFGGGSGAVTGTEPPNALTDMYVATRGGTGWTTKFVGLKGHEAQSNCTTLGDLKLSVFLSFRCEYFIYQGATQPPQNAPFVWDSQGNSLGRWPVSLPLIPEGDALIGSFQPSPDFSHLAFSSNNVAFTPNGQVSGIGSAYDYNSGTGETQIISRLQSGQNIPEEPGQVGNPKDYLEFPGVQITPNYYAGDGKASNSLHPGVSTNGSHILMGARTDGSEEPMLNLYMRIDDAATYEVSDGHPVDYVGMSDDGSKVYFISSEQLTADDTDTSPDLYMWSAEKAENEEPALTRISAGEGGAGNSDSCSVTWAEECGVAMPESSKPYLDNFIAGQNGDIYFYSPERLVGVDAGPNEKNLYVYRNGEVQFVTSGTVNRIETTPDDSKMAMVTGEHVTAYNSGGKREMYTYEPESRIIRCLSCPTEATPVGNVEGSLNGQYITEDGRVFFYTPDALVTIDTNHLGDVYEFVDGRPQLITTGTADQENPQIGNAGYERLSGLIGVSADGVNAYFATYDTLVPQDHNGQYIKFYDARSGGGFPEETPLQPCAAADECHGPGSEPPSVPAISSENALGQTGNAKPKKSSKKHKKHKKHQKQKRHHRTRRAHVRAGR